MSTTLHRVSPCHNWHVGDIPAAEFRPADGRVRRRVSGGWTKAVPQTFYGKRLLTAKYWFEEAGLNEG